MTIRRGRGVAAVNYPTGMNLGGDPSQALVHSTPTGNFMVTLSSVDLGQGLKQIMAQICAETIGVSADLVTIDTADTDTGPHCMGPTSSPSIRPTQILARIAWAPSPRAARTASAMQSSRRRPRRSR
jgi:CO/xanthine dehydrogenase Mo-binding subunit